LWLGLAGAGGFGLIAVAAVAFAPTTDNAPAATLPPGYQVYTAQELEAMGMVDLGPLFEMDDGSEPVVGTELRAPAAAMVVREGARVLLPLEPCCSYGTITTGMLLRAEAPWGRLAVHVFTGGTGQLVIEGPGIPAKVDANGEPARAAVSVWNAGVGPVYGDATREPVAAAVDTRGHLFIAPQPFDADAPIDYDTGRSVRLADSTRISTGWLPEDSQVHNFCDDPCSVAVHTSEIMTAPVAGTLLACAPDGILVLQADGYSLRFRRQVMVVGGHESRCDGEPREVAAGDEIGYPGHWLINAEGATSEPLDVSRSPAGTLWVGEGMKPDPACPCMGRN
jgi:hypothetical protein